MTFNLFLLFALVPILELYLLIKIGGIIGALNTILIIAATAVLGAYLAKAQGFVVIRKLQQAMEEGRFPGRELIDGLCILLGGFTLLTPGFITDLLGLTLLFPYTRTLYIAWVGKIIQKKMETGTWKIKNY